MKMKRGGISVRNAGIQLAKRDLKRLPKNLNLMGFEMALLLNFGISTDLTRLKQLYDIYNTVKSQNIR